MISKLLRFVSIPLLLLLCSPSAQATDPYPTRPIEMIVGYSAGGPTDVTARVLAKKLTEILGQSVVVSNKTGSASLIATKEILHSEPNGYKLLFASLGHNVNPLILPEQAGYDPVKDFAPITLVATQPLVVVTGHNSEYGSMKELIAKAKQGPGKVSFGSAGNGGSAHLAAELLGLSAGVEMLHVPFRGNAPALAEVIAGRVSFMFYPSVGIAEQVSAKRLRVLAVGPSTGLKQFQDAPTMAGLGYKGFDDAAPWVGLLAPKGTPNAIVDRLNKAMNTALDTPEVREQLEKLGNVIVGGSQQTFIDYLQKSTATMKNVIESAKVTVQK
ncbi:tripartite tricarboxylate transporter substrate binding protein [Parapusillimonas sp. SGNA-6]|nr:tripartite tricarboxylate transporter substrate binding protein [Parapusillimonas sp. SGNA-6]